MKKAIVFLGVFSVFTTVHSFAADWPQWRGPNRDGYSADTGLAKTWPKDGPKLLWTFDDAGIGYGQPAVVGDMLYMFGGESHADGEFVMAIDLNTGKQKWKKTVPIIKKDPSFKSEMWGGGPRSTPTVDGDHLYFVGAHGDLACLSTESGDIRWHISMTKDLGGKVMNMWGFSESALIDGDLLICSPGYDAKGDGKGAVQALDKKTGKVKWVCEELTDQASYSSPVISDGGGVHQYVVATAKGIAGVRAADGKLLWKDKVGTKEGIMIPTPIVDGDDVYATNDYGAGCSLFKLEKSENGVKANSVYVNKNMMNHHGGVVKVGAHIYGTTGNASNRKVLPFICQDMKSGEVLWKEEKAIEPSAVSFADGFLYCYGQMTGTLVKVAPSAEKYIEEARFKIPRASDLREKQGGVWTHPVIAQGKLLLRDQDLLFCYDLK